MKDIVYRLQEMALRLCGATMEAAHTHRLEWEAADTIEALRGEIKENIAFIRKQADEIGRLRNETLEEAAKAAEGFPKNREWAPGSFYDTLRREVAQDIRKLK